VWLGCVCAWIGHVSGSWVCQCLDRLCGVGFGLFQVEKSQKNWGSNLGTLAFSATLVTNNTNGISLDSKKAALDSMAVCFHNRHWQTCCKLYPATDFSNGITNLTKILAAERYGLVFLFVILSTYDEGWQILDTTLQKKTTTNLRKF
jgi:hypothetical protein